MKQTYNLRTLVSVTVTDKKETFFKFQTYKKFLFGERKEGFKSIYTSGVFTQEELERGDFLDTKLLVEYNIVYDFPYVTLAFIDGAKKKRIFKTYQEALVFSTWITKTIPVTLEDRDGEYKMYFNNTKK